MDGQLAVMLDKQAQLADLWSLETVCIYNMEGINIVQKNEVVWDYTIEKEQCQVGEIRRYNEKLLNLLGDCRILVGKQMTGVLFQQFIKQGIELCEAEHFSQVLLEQIAYDFFVKEKKKECKRENVEKIATYPIPIDKNGNYYLDMIQLQKQHPDISSKKALLPFLSHQCFVSVVVRCSHVMPWLDGVIKQFGYEMNVSGSHGEQIIRILGGK